MRVQRVLVPGVVEESWTVVGEDFAVIAPVEEFLAHLSVVGRSPGTVRAYAFDLRDFFEFLDSRQVDWTCVRLASLGEFVGWLRLPPRARRGGVAVLPGSEHCSGATVNRKLSAVGSFYEFHARNGVDVAALLSELRPGLTRRGAWRPFLAHLGTGSARSRAVTVPSSRRLPRALDQGEVEAIRGACERLRDRFFIELLAGTGMRVGEALGLRHEDVDAAGRQVVVRRRVNANGARVKSGERTIPVHPRLVRSYAQYMFDEYGALDADHVFVNLWSGERGRPWRYWNVTNLVERLRRRSGVQFTVHMLRHTYATQLLTRDVPAEVVQKLLGHASITTTTETYAHLKVDEVRRSLERAGWLPGADAASTGLGAR